MPTDCNEFYYIVINNSANIKLPNTITDRTHFEMEMRFEFFKSNQS